MAGCSECRLGAGAAVCRRRRRGLHAGWSPTTSGWSISSRCTCSGDPQEALDLSQEVFLRVFRTLPQFRGQSTLRTWIYRIVVNQASNRQRWWRRRHARQQVALDDHAATHGELPESRNFAMPDRVLAATRDVEPRVAGARTPCRSISARSIVLREIDGLSYEEIATSLGVAVGTVKSRLARARENRCAWHWGRQ